MDNVSKYLEDLKSPNKNKRFDACYYLRLMDEIPDSAMLALQDATNDPDHLVAKEARKAIQVHSLPKEMRINTSSKDVDLGELFPKVFNSSTQNFLKTYGLLILVLLVVSMVIFGADGLIFLLAFLGGPILFLILVTGGIGFMVSASRGNKYASPAPDINGSKVDGLHSIELGSDVLRQVSQKIEANLLDGSPEEFYKAGIIFIEKGQFDDGILEFVKIIKTALPDSELYKMAEKELMNMGFSEADIRKIN